MASNSFRLLRWPTVEQRDLFRAIALWAVVVLNTTLAARPGTADESLNARAVYRTADCQTEMKRAIEADGVASTALEDEAWLFALTFSDDRWLAASNGHGWIMVWDLDKPSPRFFRDKSALAIRFRPESREIITGTMKGELRIIHADKPDRAQSFALPERDFITAIACASKDRIYVATFWSIYEVDLRDKWSRRIVRGRKRDGEPGFQGLALSPRRNQMLWISSEGPYGIGRLFGFDLAEQRETASLTIGAAYLAAHAETGVVAAGGACDGPLVIGVERYLRPEKGRETSSLAISKRPGYYIKGLCMLGPERLAIAWNRIGGEEEADIAIVDVKTERETASFTHKGSMVAIAASTDGRYFASCSYDGRLIVWKTDEFQDAYRRSDDGVLVKKTSTLNLSPNSPSFNRKTRLPLLEAN